VALSTLFADFIKAGFGGCGFFRRGFNEADFLAFNKSRTLIINSLFKPSQKIRRLPYIVVNQLSKNVI